MTSTADDHGRSSNSALPHDDPIAEFARLHHDGLRAALAAKAAPVSAPVDPDTALHWARAALGALNRRDLPLAITAAQHLLLDHGSTVVAIDFLSGILLAGIPQGGLRRGARITLDAAAAPGDPDHVRAVRLASDLMTGIASGDDRLAAPVLHALRGQHGLDVLVVLLSAAAARVEQFVGVDGDTVDAYYAATRDRDPQNQPW